MSKRKSMGTSRRFEIFKRDGYRCVYCGVTPAQEKLRVDHVVPVSKGGKDDENNLVTSCFECNAGKAGRPLEERRFKTEFATEADKEHAQQIRDWLAIQRDISNARDEVADDVQERWEALIGPISEEMAKRLPKLIREWPIEKIVEAMTIVGRKMGSVGEEYGYRQAQQQQRYFYGVLRKWKDEEALGLKPTPAPHRSSRAQAVMDALLELNTKPGTKLEDLLEKFELLCFGRECERVYGFNPSKPITRVRGLLIRFTPGARPGSYQWNVEDDLEWKLEDDWYAIFDYFKPDLYLAMHKNEEVSSNASTLVDALEESKAFADYLRGVGGAVDRLLRLRVELKWASPEVAP